MVHSAPVVPTKQSGGATFRKRTRLDPRRTSDRRKGTSDAPEMDAPRPETDERAPEKDERARERDQHPPVRDERSPRRIDPSSRESRALPFGLSTNNLSGGAKPLQVADELFLVAFVLEGTKEEPAEAPEQPALVVDGLFLVVDEPLGTRERRRSSSVARAGSSEGSRRTTVDAFLTGNNPRDGRSPRSSEDGAARRASSFR